MAKVTFIRDFDFSPAAFNGRLTIAYKAGMTLSVTRECARKARHAEVIKSSPRKEADNGQ